MKRMLALVMPGILIFFAQYANSQSANDLSTIKFTVSEAPEWSAMLKRDSGWFGGDGIYTIPLNGIRERYAKPEDKVLFIFSDSMIGAIRDHTMAPGYKMIHNTVALLQGGEPVNDHMHFYWDTDKKGEAESVFVPKTPMTQKDDYFWLGDGFVDQALHNNIYIFGYRVRNVSSGAFGFKEVGNVLIKVNADSTPPFLQQQQMDTPFYLEDAAGESGSFGAGVYMNTKEAKAPNPDGYLYIYGVRGMAKKLMVARVKPADLEKFSQWTFWDGETWSPDMAKVADVTKDVSNELSVTALPDGRYALVFQVDGMSTTVAMRIGKTPYGPFGPIIKLWDCKNDLAKKTYLVYNAKAHPSISKPGELIISYNINSLDFINDLKVDPNLYRPRFIRVKFQ
jgi:hypothetical protein